MSGDNWIYHEPDNWTRLLDDQENAQGWAHQLEQEMSMTFKHEEGRGSGYKNDSANPKAPNLKGTMVWKGETIHWLSGAILSVRIQTQMWRLSWKSPVRRSLHHGQKGVRTSLNKRNGAGGKLQMTTYRSREERVEGFWPSPCTLTRGRS